MTTQTVNISTGSPAIGERKFSTIKNAIAKQFKDMAGLELFRTQIEGDDLWAYYLQSFPEGSNPLFRERTEHDCSCCRNFIRNIGNVVAILDRTLISIWDVQVDDAVYQAVADAMSAEVKSYEIENLFRAYNPTIGTDRNYEDSPNGVLTWEHFSVRVPTALVCSKDRIGDTLSQARADHDVLLRSLTELRTDAVDAVLELIAQGSLYRGEEHKRALDIFRTLKGVFGTLPPDATDAFVWGKSREVSGAVARIRNTSIGTLLVDLSNGRDLEGAVRAYESVVAPANYKRPTALITPKMIDQAKSKIAELGLLSALERRYATSDDVTVNNILFVDRSIKRKLTGDVFDQLSGSAGVKPKSFDKVDEVGIERFIAEVLPRIDSLEILFENRLSGNLVSLIAPADPAAGRLFKWENGFSWSYNGDFADSVKERVKRAGGNVTGDVCCRLAWFNYDDLDLHMVEPTGNHIYYGNPGPDMCGGKLDVDMNARRAHTREPVENIFYSRISQMREGAYRLFINQFHQRETKFVGFEVEVDVKGALHRFVYDRPVHGNVEVAVLTRTADGDVRVIGKLPEASASKTVWDVKTETFQPVRAAMLSPNYWDDFKVGNKHYFFMLEGCRNDGGARGFYNEFLRSDLDQHRKVFEIVGSKVRTEEERDQLSGLGFSSTQKNHITVRVTGSITRVLRVVF
jgi:hypothetical protein